MTPHDLIHIALPIITGFGGFWFATVLNRLGRDIGEGQIAPRGPCELTQEERDLFGGRGQGGRP